MPRILTSVVLAGALALTNWPVVAQSQPAGLALEETTIAQVHAAMKAGKLTCRQLVDAYLARIAADEARPVPLNAIVVLNPDVRKQADELDRRFKQSGLTGPLHCVPTIVKDNYETIGMQSANGSASMAGFISNKDAFLVKRIRAAGALVLAKSNMAEFAFSPLETVNSILGTTRNPYDRDRVPAGSSGGTAAAVASNFGLVGLGSDTGNSIRGPSSHNSLVGIRSTMGLTSRAGVIPLSYLADIAGPMTRTVEDAVAVFQVIVGEDPDDPATAASHGRAIPDYRASLIKDGLTGARIGVLHQAFERANLPVDDDITKAFAKALDDMKSAGATIVDQVMIERVQRQPAAGGGTCRGFKYDINEYLAKQGDRVPVHNLDEIIASGKFHPSARGGLTSRQTLGQGMDSDACKAEMAYRAAFGAAIAKTMDDLKLDALVYPTWSQPPQTIGATNQQQAGDNSQVYSPSSGFPAINVPMGYSHNDTLPIGMTILGRAWSEATLIKLAYAYEQATHHRRPPR